ncbi:MAG: FHA domain-containing protein [Thermoanaerobaculia bacterium]
MAAFLIVDEGGEKRHEVVGRAIVGRDADCDILLSNLSASRKHAVLEETVAGWTVRDLSSINGTFVNGKRVVDAVLMSGDDLRFGDVKAVFRVEEKRAEVSGTGKLLRTLSIKPVRKARPVAVVIATLAGVALLVAATLWSKGCGTHGPAVSVTAPR